MSQDPYCKEFYLAWSETAWAENKCSADGLISNIIPADEKKPKCLKNCALCTIHTECESGCCGDGFCKEKCWDEFGWAQFKSSAGSSTRGGQFYNCNVADDVEAVAAFAGLVFMMWCCAFLVAVVPPIVAGICICMTCNSKDDKDVEKAISKAKAIVSEKEQAVQMVGMQR